MSEWRDLLCHQQCLHLHVRCELHWNSMSRYVEIFYHFYRKYFFFICLSLGSYFVSKLELYIYRFNIHITIARFLHVKLLLQLKLKTDSSITGSPCRPFDLFDLLLVNFYIVSRYKLTVQSFPTLMGLRLHPVTPVVTLLFQV